MFQRYHNAVSDLASVNASIQNVTSQLNDATEKYNQAIAMIASCNNEATGCLSKTGRHISSWRDQRDQYSGLMTTYKKQLQELLAIQSSLSDASNKTSESIQTASEAQQSISNAESVQTATTAKKWLVYGGIGAGAIILGLVAWKILKKKKK